LRFATQVGIGAGVLALGIGLVRAVILLLSGRSVVFDFEVWQLLLYVGGWTLACWAGAITWPVTRWRGGGLMIGVLGAACLIGAVTMIEDGVPWRWSSSSLQTWLFLTALFGGVVGFWIERDRARR